MKYLLTILLFLSLTSSAQLMVGAAGVYYNPQCKTPSAITGTLSACVGLTSTLSDASTGGTWTSSSTTIATVGTSSGIVTGVASGTATISYVTGVTCYAVATFTVNANPAAISGTLTVATSATTQLTDATAGGTWSSSTTTVATIGTAGLVTGVATGTSTISYTLSTGCMATAVVTVTTATNPFTHSYSLVIDHTKCGSSNSTDFTVTVKCNATNLKTVANGGVVQSVTSGIPNDIVFSSSSTYGSYLSYAVESYDATTGTLVAKVKISTVSSSADVTFYMGVGSSTITTFQGGSVGAAYDANTKAMYPFSNGTTLSFSDVSSSGLTLTDHGTPATTATTGQVDGAANLSAANLNYFTAASAPINLASDFTVSFWYNATSQTPTSDNDRFIGFVNGNTNFQLIMDAATGKHAVLLNRTGVATINQLVYGTYSFSTWVHVMYVVSGSTGIFYKNGSSVASTGSTSIGVGSTNAYAIGSRPDNVGSTFYKGILDDVRFDQTARGADWALTLYNNQNSAGNIGSAGFITYTLIY